MHQAPTRWLLLLMPLLLPLLARNVDDDDDPNPYDPDDVFFKKLALSWQFMPVPDQPPGGSLVASLPIKDYNDVGQRSSGNVIAFQNADSDDNNGADPGITWEVQEQNKGGAEPGILWSKQTNLLFSSPPSRSQADASIMTWGTEMSSADYGSNLKAYGVVMFGGQSGGKALGGTLNFLFS